jgi:hypothetical protein
VTRLAPGDVERYRRDGVVFPVRLFEPAAAADWLGRLERIEAARAGRLPPAFNAKPHLLIPFLWDIVHDARALDAVEDLLGPDILCYGSSFIIKNPGDGRYVAWHQDATYWGLAAPLAVTVWIAFTPSTPENGCVRVVPGTHLETLPHENSRDPRNLLGRRERVLAPVEEDRAVDLVLAPGEASMHHVLILHGSNENRSAGRRVGFSVRYIPSHVSLTGESPSSATLVRGRNRSTFELEERPEGEFHPAAVARHSAVLRRGMSTIFASAERPGRAVP